MKNILLVSLFLLTSKSRVIAQSINCGQAVQYLLNYASQVNQAYINEFNSIIPNQRCPAYDAWGRPYHPQVVQNCRYQMLVYLNQWYGQQCGYVNRWYVQLAQACAKNPDDHTNSPAPGQNSGGGQSPEIETEPIEELTAGVDEDKAVRITIPKTPSGFKPRQ